MTTPSIGALNTGSADQFLDHIAPLADLLNIPLIVSEEESLHLLETYYPHTKKELLKDPEFHLGELASRFDALIGCRYWPSHLKQTFRHLHGKNVDLIFCPHGQSDKGFGYPSLAPYAEQDIVLLYGDLLKDMLEQLQIKIDRYATIGNYRRLHYQKHKSFYDNLADKEIFSHLVPNQPTLLYAPTWKDGDRSTSFFDWSQTLYKELPSHWNLIVKVHPLLEQKDPAHYFATLNALTKIPNGILVSGFPPIYPILERSDCYLGDFSSVGYDFLAYQRPMFFFSHPKLPAGPLHSCGHFLNSQRPLFSLIEQKLEAKNLSQQNLYQHAFGKDRTEEEIAQMVRSLIL